MQVIVPLWRSNTSTQRAGAPRPFLSPAADGVSNRKEIEKIIITDSFDSARSWKKSFSQQKAVTFGADASAPVICEARLEGDVCVKHLMDNTFPFLTRSAHVSLPA